ncbi:MAG TPA: hypothetical protein VNT79_18840, partial [Phycisphaerae bacterium]|nr:hypothetical protein [Phycisphaerae bacterium]
MSRLRLSAFIFATISARTASVQADLGIASEFLSSVILDAGAPVHAMAAGELDLLASGHEIVFLRVDGDVVLVKRAADAWVTTQLLEGDLTYPIPVIRMRTTLNVADVRPDVPGLEIVSYTPNNIHVFFHDSSGNWSVESVDESLPLMFGFGWGARPGEIVPSYPGLEILLIWEGAGDVSGGALYGRTPAGWERVTEMEIYGGEVAMDTVMGDVNPDNPGNEIILTTEMGPTYEVIRPANVNATPWPRTTLWDDFDNSGWVMCVADVDPAT